MPNRVSILLQEYVAVVKKIYSGSLKKVLLYGSYARGDYSSESDIDIMILVDVDEDEIKLKGHMLSDYTFDINYENDVKIMPIVQNEDFFIKWINAYPFFNNIANKRVELYAE